MGTYRTGLSLTPPWPACHQGAVFQRLAKFSRSGLRKSDTHNCVYPYNTASVNR
jgi:hypothetical protein